MWHKLKQYAKKSILPKWLLKLYHMTLTEVEEETLGTFKTSFKELKLSVVVKKFKSAEFDL